MTAEKSPAWWRQCEQNPDHAIINVRCDVSGDDVAVRIPYAHRHSSIGWGDRKRVSWGDKVGVHVTEGEHGITAMDEAGELHHLRHGEYDTPEMGKAMTASTMGAMVPQDLEGAAADDDDTEEEEIEASGLRALKLVKGVLSMFRRPMRKAKQELKPGQRWITVKPNGADEKGVPVLIQPAGDGTHRIVGGAGGKLNHLRLKNVGSASEHKEKAKEKAKERRGAEKERKAGQSPEEKGAEKEAKADIEAKKKHAERKFIGLVRSKLGGVQEDLDEKPLQGLSDGARNLILSRHHRKQLTQAIAQKDAAAKSIRDDKVADASERSQIQRKLHEEAPHIAAAVQDLADQEVDLRHQEQEERRTERAQRKQRQTTGQSKVGEKAAEQVAEMLDDAGDIEGNLKALGGRGDGPDAPASVEMSRRAAVAMSDAKILHEAATGGDTDDATALKVISEALERARVDEDADDATKRDALMKEAARKVRRSEVMDVRADRFNAMEQDPELGPAKSQAALNFTDSITELARDASDAKKLGLTESERTPLQEAEIADIMDVLEDAQRLRAAQREFQDMKKQAESGAYDKSRRAVQMKVGEPTEKVVQSIEDDVRRELTERLLGVANPKRSAHLQSVANGHYASLADVSLGVAGQRYLDRTVVDAIGLGNATMLMRHAMEADGHSPADVLKALEAHHVGTMNEITTKALDAANSYVPGIEASVGGVDDIEHAMGKLDIHEDAINEAQRAVGAALGRMEGTATLAQTFRTKQPDTMTLDMPTGDIHGTLQWVHAAGLKTGDYHIDYTDKKLHVPKSSWDKLIHREDQKVLDARQAAHDIKAGKQDEAGWLPEGLVSREVSTFTDPTPNAATHRVPLDLQPSAPTGGLFGAPAPTGGVETERTAAHASMYGEEPAATTPGLFGEQANPDHATWTKRRDAIMSGDEDAAVATLGAKPDEDAPKFDHEQHAERVRRVREVMAHSHEATADAAPGGLSDGEKSKIDDHVGSRLADGERAQDIMSDMFSPEITRNVSDIDGYIEHVKQLFPLVDEETGRAKKYEENADHFKGLASDFMQRKYGSETGSFHAQTIEPGNAKTHEAIYRTLAEHPDAKVAFKPTGQLTPQDKGALRKAFYKRMGIDPKVGNDVAGYKRAYSDLGEAPEKEVAGLFGKQINTAWTDWDNQRSALASEFPRASLQDSISALGPSPDPAKVAALKEAAAKAPTAWGRYVERHGSLDLAQKAIQDEAKGRFTRAFVDHHGKLTGNTVRHSITEVTNAERHRQATATREEQAKIKAESQSIYAKVRERTGGQFAAEGEGAVKKKYTEFLKDEVIAKQNQGSFFATKDPDTQRTKEPGAGERYTVGEQAENEIGSLINKLGAPFEPGKPIGLKFQMNMDGDRIHQQRVIKQMDANGGRMGAWLGTGSGKSATSIGAFTHRHGKGKATHGLYIVPSAVQTQFGGEMVKFTEPGKYKFATGEGKSHADRVAMLKDPSVHMRVMTHQAYRDTTLKLMQEHHGVGRKEMLSKLAGASHGDRAQLLRDAFDAHGIPQHFTYWDEAHMGTHRDGTDPSGLNLMLQATTHPTNSGGGMMLGTATPHKNDTSEVHSMASILDPHRYADKHAFMQAFPSDVAHAPDAIRRELNHLTYSAKIPPSGVDRHDGANPAIQDGKKSNTGGALKLNPEHQSRVDRVSNLYHLAQRAQKSGRADVESMRELSPAQFAATPEHEHEHVARRLQQSLGIIRESAMRRAINQAPAEINTKLQKLTEVVKHDVNNAKWTHRDTGKEHTGKPSVIFTDSLAEARQIHEHLGKQGLRSALYHGGLNAKQRESVRGGFNPEPGQDARHDVVVATSAAEAGINMQRGKVIHHYDVPMTEKSHNQRSGRAYRQGQKGDVDVHNWHTDTEYDKRALRRLKKKEGLASVFQSPLGNLDEHGIANEYQKVLSHKHQAADHMDIAAK